MEPPRDAPQPSDAILTVPNLLTFLRLGLIPAFLWVSLVPDRLDIGVSLALLGLATDLADGKIARRFGQVSKLGVALDPLSDRLALASGAVVMVVHDLIPLWAVLLIAVRDGGLLIAAAVLKSRGGEIPPVSRVGKYGSFGVSLAIALFLGSGAGDVADPNDGVRAAGWAAYAVGMPLYYIAAGGYARATFGRARASR